MKDIHSALYSTKIIPDYEQNRRFYDGDHWQDSHGYMGQLPPVSSPHFSATVELVKNNIVSENVIKEVIDAHLNGIVGRNPDWQVLKGGAKMPAAADNALTAWWDASDMISIVEESAQKMLVETKTLVRMYVPFGYVSEKGLPILNSFADALEYVHFEIVNREKGGVYRDAARRMPFSIYNYSRRIGKKDVDFAELSFADTEGLTHLVTFKDVKSFEPEDLLAAGRFRVADSVASISGEAARLFAKIDATAEFERLDLKGHLYLFELSGKEFITEQIRSLQRKVNLAWTMGGKNINVAGVRQRDYLNAAKPASIATGAAANFLYGIPIQNEKGEIIGMTSPNVSITDPSDPSYFIKARDAAYAAILGQCGQRVRLMAGDATASGISRIKAMSEFIATLKRTARTMDRFGRWLIEITSCFADAFCDENIGARDYRCEFKIIVDAGGVDNETRTLDQTDVREGRLSLESYLSKTGVEDVSAEIVRLRDVSPELGNDVPVGE